MEYLASQSNQKGWVFCVSVCIIVCVCVCSCVTWYTWHCFAELFIPSDIWGHLDLPNWLTPTPKNDPKSTLIDIHIDLFISKAMKRCSYLKE